MKRIISLVLVLSLLVAFAGCSNKTQKAKVKEDKSYVYMALVNKTNKLPVNWTENIELETAKNSMGEEYQVEKKTLAHFNALREELLKEGIDIELDSTYRTVEEQQDLWERFEKEYGIDYVKKYVAVPGYSEHHTGLVIDICLKKDGKVIDENDDMIAEKEIFAKIHSRLAKHGFILRYLDGKEHITGYNYEPWHLRYIDNVKVAKEIMDKGITLEEYLGEIKDYGVKIDYGNSNLYSKEQLTELVKQIKCNFANEGWCGCELKSIRYAGDEFNTKEEINRVSSGDSGKKYTSVAKFLVDFHTPKETLGAFETDFDYNDYSFWLACDSEGSWDIVDYGY